MFSGVICIYNMIWSVIFYYILQNLLTSTIFVILLLNDPSLAKLKTFSRSLQINYLCLEYFEFAQNRRTQIHSVMKIRKGLLPRINLNIGTSRSFSHIFISILKKTIFRKICKLIYSLFGLFCLMF